jgi:hypothetical protein
MAGNLFLHPIPSHPIPSHPIHRDACFRGSEARHLLRPYCQRNLRGMQSLIVLILFAGFACIVHGVYEERMRAVEKDVRVEYRFLPRTLYDEQLEAPDLEGKFKGMFDSPSSSPWADANIGRDVGSALQQQRAAGRAAAPAARA